MDIIDKRRKEGWNITFFCTPRSVVCHICTTDEFDEAPQVDVNLKDLSSALKFARSVCRRTKRAVEAASAAVVEAPLTAENFLALLAGDDDQGDGIGFANGKKPPNKARTRRRAVPL